MRAADRRGSDETSAAGTLADEGDRAVVTGYLVRAEADLVAVTGGASLCRVGNGPEAGSAKYAEGRYAALRELRQLLRSPDADALASAVRLLGAWQVARAEARGPAWAAYRAGGVADLQHVVDELTTITEGAHR